MIPARLAPKIAGVTKIRTIWIAVSGAQLTLKQKVLLGLVLYSAQSGGDSFADLRAADLSAGTRGVVFVLVLRGRRGEDVL